MLIALLVVGIVSFSLNRHGISAASQGLRPRAERRETAASIRPASFQSDSVAPIFSHPKPEALLSPWQSVFAQLPFPKGVTTDSSGNVFVTWDATFSARLSKFAPDGTLLGQIVIGGLEASNFGNLATDPTTGATVHLFSNGRMQVFDNVTGEGGFILGGASLGQIPIDMQVPVYDINIGSFSFISGILPTIATYGDFEIVQRGNQIDLFLAVLSHTTAHSYVLRVRIIAPSLKSLLTTPPTAINSRVVVASGVPPEQFATPPGIAVNGDGVVLTSLPVCSNLLTCPGSYYALTTFGVDFPEDQTPLPRLPYGRNAFPNRGMTTDRFGNFHIAADGLAPLGCPAASGSIVLVPGDLTAPSCQPLSFSITDIALNPGETVAYVTAFNTGTVVQIPISQPTCNYSISPAARSFSSSGGTGSVTVTTTAGCNWSISGVPAWITIVSGNGGTGSGAVNFTVAANNSTASRSANLTIAGRTFSVSQSGTCPVNAIAVGQTVNGTLAAGDCQSPLRSNGAFADRYAFSGLAGQQIAIELNSTSFDPYLYLIGPNGAVLAQDDDGGSGINSRIPADTGFFTLPSNGTYQIEAAAFGAAETGAYTLSLLIPTSVCPAITSLNPNTGIAGTIVAITGTNLAGVTGVRFANNASATFSVNTAGTVLTTSVPAGSITGPITISKAGCPDLQSGSFSIISGPTPELAVDDGSFETAVGLTNGGTSYRLNRLRPTSYPATLTSVLAFFRNTSGVLVGDPLTVVYGANPSGAENINGIALQSVAGTVQALGQLNTYTVPSLTITSGDFVVGIRMTHSAGTFPFALDTSPPSQRRSYRSSDGVTFELIDNLTGVTAGNYGIRARITQVLCPSITSLNPTSGPVGTNVTIAGENLGGITGVRFPGNIAANFNVVSNGTQIITNVPAGSTTGPITLTKPGCPDVQTGTFTTLVCTATISPTSQNLSAVGGSGSVSVVMPTGCSWMAASNAAWITITSGGSGSGSGPVAYSVAANTGPARTGTITVAGQTFTITQASGCAFAISPATQSFSAPAGTGLITVTTVAGCSWTAASNAAWISITSGGSGMGSGSVSYSVAANTGPARSGTITVAGQTFNVTQASGCASIALSPATLVAGIIGQPYNQSLSASGGIAPYGFTLVAGGLQGNVALSPAGVISGTPTSSGTFPITVRATGANGCFGERSYTLVIDVCPVITIGPGSLAAANLGTAYNQPLTATGGTPPYTFSLNSGSGPLPLGLGLSANGIISGIPSASGSFSFTVKVTDANNCTATRAYTLQVSTAGGTSGLQYYPLPRPIRLFDTRGTIPGFPACEYLNQPLAAGGELVRQARITCDGITIPAAAEAIVGNATVITPSAGGFVTLWPDGQTRPPVSNLNYIAGQVVPNAFTVGLSAGGNFRVYSTAATHFAVDITGYYAPPGTGGLYYHPLSRPIRLFDTRAAIPGFPACEFLNQPLVGNAELARPARITCDGITIPADALAIVGNATIVSPNGGGFATLWPNGQARPPVSTLNYTAGQVVPNAFTVGLGSDGQFRIYSSAGTDFIVDVTGYYSPTATDINGAGLFYTPLTTPIRLFDTRAPIPGFPACEFLNQPLLANGEIVRQARVLCDGITIPAGAQAIVGNATAITPAGSGFITLWPNGQARPPVSNLNYAAGQVVPNAFTVGLGGDGQFRVYSVAGTHFIVDLNGYFAP